MRRTTFQDLGFPPRSTIRRILVCEPARSLIAQFILQDDPTPRHHLYCRRFDERSYVELVPHEDGHDNNCPTASPVLPYVYFNRLIWTERGGDWDGLYRVHCENRVVERLLPRSTERTGCVSDIVGINGEGTRLFLVSSSAIESGTGCQMGYGVAALDLVTFELSAVTELPAVFV